MKTNLFMNPYQQPENKLTYNFLSLVELLNDREFMEWLLNDHLIEKPVIEIEGVLGGGVSNPDGKIVVKNRNNKNMSVFIENKTSRRQLSTEQLYSHLEWLTNTDKLLVITPRPSDKSIITQMNKAEIIFKTWSEIADYLSRITDNAVAQQFIQYGKLSGEFEEFGEITKNEIEVYSAYYKMNFDGKVYSIFESFLSEYRFEEKGFKKIESVYRDNWGRKGLEISPTIVESTYGQWMAYSLYYSMHDHKIKYIKNEPEICFFFDINMNKKELLQNDNEFINLIERLTKIGFESNLDNTLTKNKWRLMIYRKPISEFDSINLNSLIGFSNEVIGKLIEEKAFSHTYFKEFA